MHSFCTKKGYTLSDFENGRDVSAYTKYRQDWNTHAIDSSQENTRGTTKKARWNIRSNVEGPYDVTFILKVG